MTNDQFIEILNRLERLEKQVASIPTSRASRPGLYLMVYIILLILITWPGGSP